MQKKIFLCATIIIGISVSVFAQQLPLGTCGVVNIYDAAGNRTKRIYFCNNGVDFYPTKAKPEFATATEVQQVDELYPNPTTGRFAVYFSKELKNADILLTDLNGKVIMQFRATGYSVDFDLSMTAAGVYFVRISDGKNVITKKVVKQ